VASTFPPEGIDHVIADAQHAVGQYITQGPWVAPEDMKVSGLEGVRARVANSPLAEHHQAAGWVAVEQAFAVAASPDLCHRYPTGMFIEAAVDSFTTSLDRYDPSVDPPDHLLQVELAMASLGIYGCWAAGQTVEASMIAEYHEEVGEVGRGLLDLQDRLIAEGADQDVQGEARGFAGELVTLLAFNRRQINGGVIGAVAVPSTFRQNRAVRKGSLKAALDKTQPRGNWDASVITRGNKGWGVVDRLQVKNFLLAAKDTTGIIDKNNNGLTQTYADEITRVGVKQHILTGLVDVDTWGALKILTGDSTTGQVSQRRRHAAWMSRELYEHIGRDRLRRVAAGIRVVYGDIAGPPSS